METSQNREEPPCKSFISPRLKWLSYRILKSALDISLHVRPSSLTQLISKHTPSKAGFALRSKDALKPVRDLQGEALSDYSFVCICYFPVIDTVLLLWIPTFIRLMQCSSSANFHICVLQKGAALRNVTPLCIPLSFPCIPCLILE